MTFHLTMREALPKIREAFDKKELQMFKKAEGNFNCLYSGPCAIGICFPEDMRKQIDAQEGTASVFALTTRDIISIAFNQRQDFNDLQVAHDRAVLYSDDSEEEHLVQISVFREKLEEFELKYSDESDG